MREAPRSQTRRQWLGWGLAAAICYLLAGAQVWPSNPLRLLYEGEAPPLPYRWVRPPANLPEPNQPPASGVGEIALTPAGSQSASVLTDEGQAALILRFGAIAPRPGASTVTVRITPLDPGSVAPPPPNLMFDGNGYRMEATYNTGEAVTLVKPATPVLRYPKHATVLLRSSGSGWVVLETHVVAGSLQLFGPSDRLGVFAAAAPSRTSPLPWPRYAVALAVGGVLLALAAAVLARRRRAPRRRPRSP